jgi:hypothetical protein
MISYILPTRNRCELLLRAIDSCLRAATLTAPTQVIVVDGGSTDGTAGALRERYNGDPRVRILQQDPASPGFMNACFQGVDAVATPFVTFMYDDDVLSPYIGDMYGPVLSGEADFVFGFGAITTSSDVRTFQPLAVFKRHDPKFILAQYFGARDLPFTALPASPICCLTSREHILEWRDEVISFCSKTPLRRYLMMKRNIGPDQMIYLSALLRSALDISVCFTAVAQFSAHQESMSVRYNKLDLSVGYWLSRVYVIDKLIAAGEFELAARCAGFLLVRGVDLAARAVRDRNGAFARGVLAELGGLTRSLAGNGYLRPALAHSARSAARIARHWPALTTPE